MRRIFGGFAVVAALAVLLSTGPAADHVSHPVASGSKVSWNVFPGEWPPASD